ncbi:MAG: hypothetical protein ACTSQP_17015 [Promethearchaeota archaeon]
MTHGQIFSLWDTGFMGYSELSILFQNYYLEVSEIKKSFIQTVSSLEKDSILILNFNIEKNYTEDEIQEIISFVKRGGNLFVIGEHSGYNLDDKINPILENFDMKLTEMDIEDNISSIPGNKYWTISNSPFFNLDNICLWFGAALNLTGSAFPIALTSSTANYPNQPIMAGFVYNNSNKGKVFSCGDSEWLWNANSSYGGIHYGNNSELVMKILDWFYDSNLSKAIENGFKIYTDYNLITIPKNSNFTLNLTCSMKVNITALIKGGKIFPQSFENISGLTSWTVNISNNGYIRFSITNNKYNFNISRYILFYAGNFTKKALFIQTNYSRTINTAPDGLFKFSYKFFKKNYSVYASNKVLNYSKYDCIVISNPLRKFNINNIKKIIWAEENRTRIIFINCPFSSLNSSADMPKALRLGVGNNEDIRFKALDVPINNITNYFGFNFSYRILYDPTYNENNMGYSPKIIGVNYTFYNISCFLTSTIDISENFSKELIGYNGSWAEDSSLIGIIDNQKDNHDSNNTCVLAYSKTILGAGILNYFINDKFNINDYFIEFLFNWINSGNFSMKYRLYANISSVSFKDTHFKLISIENIKDNSGNPLPNGTLLTIRHTLGIIISPNDASSSIEGFQIKIINGKINITINSVSDNGYFELSAYEAENYFVILSAHLNFSSKPYLYPIENDPSPEGNFTLKWKAHKDAKIYYIYRSNKEILNITGLKYIANVNSTSYNESLNIFGTFYYVIVASDNIKNTTISNCVSLTIHPVLNVISPNPCYDGMVSLTWKSLIGADKYYIFRRNSFITEQNLHDANTILLGVVNETYFTDTNVEQGKEHFYVIIGTNGSKNSTISNCMSVSIRIIPSAPIFDNYYLIFERSNIRIEWAPVKYAMGYKIYISKDKDFLCTEKYFLTYSEINHVNIENLEDGIYYIRIISFGNYGNSAPSEILTINIIITEQYNNNDYSLIIYIVFIINTLLIIIILAYYHKKFYIDRI